MCGHLIVWCGLYVVFDVCCWMFGLGFPGPSVMSLADQGSNQINKQTIVVLVVASIWDENKQ